MQGYYFGRPGELKQTAANASAASNTDLRATLTSP